MSLRSAPDHPLAHRWSFGANVIDHIIDMGS